MRKEKSPCSGERKKDQDAKGSGHPGKGTKQKLCWRATPSSNPSCSQQPQTSVNPCERMVGTWTRLVGAQRALVLLTLTLTLTHRRGMSLRSRAMVGPVPVSVSYSPGSQQQRRHPSQRSAVHCSAGQHQDALRALSREPGRNLQPLVGEANMVRAGRSREAGGSGRGSHTAENGHKQSHL